MMKKICTSGTSGGSLDESCLYSAEAVVSNKDLLREIFLYLPVRSLIRFELVSRYWSSLISDPQFAQDRTNRLNPYSVVPSGLFFYNTIGKSQEIESVSLDDSRIELSRVRVPSLSFLNTLAVGGSRIMILQSSNGLLLCQFKSKFQEEYCVCNPTTKKSNVLPHLILNQRGKASGFTLAFDPLVSAHYKVLCIVYESCTQIRIGIYSSETGKWHISSCCFDKYYFPHQTRTGFYWNGTIHWIISGSTQYYSYEYDLEKDRFKGCSMPAAPDSVCDPRLRYFGESKGHLHLVYVRNSWSKKFQVLERDRETLKWSVKYRVHITHLLSKFPEICVEKSKDCMPLSKVEYAFSILSVYKGEKEEDSALVLAIRGKVISYNLHDKTSKVVCELPSQVVDTSGNSFTTCYHHCTGFNFIESLAAV